MQIQNRLRIIYHSGFGFRPRKGRPLMKKPKSALIIALVLTALFAFISCEAKNSEDTLVNVYFGDITARAIDETAFDVTHSQNITSSTVLNETADNLYWAYSAVKKDNLFKTGETKDKDGNVIFKNISDEKGLNKSISFSRGAWEFKLKAYSTEAARTAGTNPIYTGTTTSTIAKASTAVPVSLDYAYSTGGTGNATFKYTVSLTQNATLGTTYTIESVKVTATPKTSSGTAQTVTLTAESGSNVYKGTISNLDYGLVNVQIDVTIGGTVYSTSPEDYIVMTDLNTEFAGNTEVTINEGANVSLSFSSTVPTTQQPDKSKIS